MNHLYTLVFTTAMLGTGTASADQCALNSAAVNTKAITLIKPGSRVLEYCEPCGDTAPGKSFEVNKVEVKQGQILVNGTGVDLAYLYVEVRTDELHNVGIRAGCGPSQVSDAIIKGRPTAPPPRPSGLPPRPAPKPRAIFPDDLVGTWQVVLRTRYSTCPDAATGTDETATWTATLTGTDLEIETAIGARLTGAVNQVPYKFMLQPTQRPSSAVVQLSQYQKDQFVGTAVRSRVTGLRSKDPVCITLQDVSAKRVP